MILNEFEDSNVFEIDMEKLPRIIHYGLNFALSFDKYSLQKTIKL